RWLAAVACCGAGRPADPAIRPRGSPEVGRAFARAHARLGHARHVQRAPGRSAARAWRSEYEGRGRVFGQGTREHFAEGARPDFDGTFAGFQAGADLLRLESISGHSDHIGFYVGQARASGAVHGSVDGFEGAPAGHVDLDATRFGGYWTPLGPSNWDIDAVLQGTYFQTAANSIRGVANNFSGRGFAASIEGGYPIPLVSWLTFEPQVQGIWQRTSFDDTLDPFSTISFDRSNVFTGRVGALLRGTFGSTGVAVWQPYLKGNVWWGSNGVDTSRSTATASGQGATGTPRSKAAVGSPAS